MTWTRYLHVLRWWQGRRARRDAAEAAWLEEQEDQLAELRDAIANLDVAKERRIIAERWRGRHRKDGGR